jgi:hypothetical protein
VFCNTQTAFNWTSCVQKAVYDTHPSEQRRSGHKTSLQRGQLKSLLYPFVDILSRSAHRYIIARRAPFYCIQNVTIQYCLRCMHRAVGLRGPPITWVAPSAFCFTACWKKALCYLVEHSQKGTERPRRQADIAWPPVSTSFPIKHTK